MTVRSITASLILATLGVTVLTACGGDDARTTAVEPATVNAAASSHEAAAEVIVLSADEIDGLVFMREEEKLARDVYLALFDLWGEQVFENIAASEERHTTAVAGLLEDFGIADPVTDDTVGVFTNPDLAALYDDLVEQGSASLADALAVGALIEDLDIADLRRWLEDTEDPDIQRVYANLLRGSGNHLRAFTSLLEAGGGTYTATYLAQDEIDEILAAGTGRGRQSGDHEQARSRRGHRR